ncbi:hydroxycarboxylic acid receptor 1-like [Carassius auratus]|uniref:Hydroxycarboxylic acid receptor 1-like n=1 Tax=Carassius auratus TaxID=7957 RepID=A0A6P6P8Q4_CARAU|nr:hydroxycarboxylic acid receptor 1-like [Carassius auratus]
MCGTYETPILDHYLPMMFSEFLLGLIGNILALSMFFFHRDTWEPNSVYLAHLALANSLALLCLPFRADYYHRGKDWVYRDAFCHILLSYSFLTAVAVDRYLKIIHPLHRMGLCYALWFSWPLCSHHSHDCLPPNR